MDAFSQPFIEFYAHWDQADQCGQAVDGHSRWMPHARIVGDVRALCKVWCRRDRVLGCQMLTDELGLNSDQTHSRAVNCA